MHKIGKVFQVRLTPAQETQVRDLSREWGESIASVIRSLVRSALESEFDSRTETATADDS